ncbi:CBS domain containing membrane protein [Musa troglodytarum]|uniref:CBS domain containing membrane protein n=1 Tax=Musa troglodytarum TaxID=320322 RepID=A0A9E7EI83_9LILI|nr:CBS domain containing membrane protein [Musa troglodytarum]
MSPVEGCPSVFQAICSITPGIHQYKFFVDGEWRHDERQPHMVGNYGIVNTLIVTQEASMQTILSPETPNNQMNMDVDHENFRHVETTLRIAEADIGDFRNHIYEFLSTHTAYDLLPDSGKVITLDVNLPVKQAFHILYEQGIPVAPLLDTCKGEFVGVLSPLDFILILKELSSHGSNLTEEELEIHTISAWKKAKQQLSGQLIMHERKSQEHLIDAGPYDSLKDVALNIVQNQVATVPIIDSPSQEESFPHLLHLASLSGILNCIRRHFRHSSSSLPILQQAICTTPLGTWVPSIAESNKKHLTMLRSNESLSSALALLLQAQISSVPIVDDHDRLLDAYSRSDITSLAKDKTYAQIHLDEVSIYQALQLRQDANPHQGSQKGQRCHMCLRSDSLQKVMEQLANPAGSNRIEGIISLSDVFKFLLGLP